MPLRFTFHCRQRNYLFDFKVGFFIFCFALVTLFTLLGVWQLQRFEFKKELLSSFQQNLHATALPFSALQSTNSKEFQQVTVVGHYLNSLNMLVQNQFNQSQLGYEVLTPLQLTGDKKILLVDRGWVAKSEKLPKIDAVVAEQHIAGYLKNPNANQFILGKNILQASGSPLIMQKIDLVELRQITHLTFYPFILRLNPQEANGFVRNWPIVTVMPERHMGYAIQWFLMAIAVAIAFLFFCCERINKKEESPHAK